MLDELNVGVIKFNSLGAISFINKFLCSRLETDAKNLNIKQFLDKDDVTKYSEIYFTKDSDKNNDYIQTLLFGVGENKQSTLIWDLLTSQGRKIKSKVTIKQIVTNEQSEYLATIEDLSSEQIFSQKIRDRNDIIKKISLEANLDSFNIQESVKKLLKVLTNCLEVNRASIWIYSEDSIECFQLYEQDKDVFSEGTKLYEKDFPAYFDEFKRKNFIKADNALKHNATKDLKDPYLNPLNIKSMVDTAVYLDGKIFAIICCESVGEFKEWVQEDLIFLESMSKLVSLAFKDEKEHKNNINNINNAKLISLGEMASSIAHEINNPLASIQLKLELLIFQIQNKDLDINLLETDLKMIMSTSTRISKIIKGLQFFSRNTTNKLFEPFCLNSCIENTLNLCEAKITKNGIVLIKEVTTDPIFINGNDIQISQVLINLINNSFDAVQDYDEKWIKISLKEDKDNIMLSVTDSGVGIPSHLVDKILLPFFTTKEVGKGTGLGLSVSNNIVSSHNGELYIDTESKNTKFNIKFKKD